MDTLNFTESLFADAHRQELQAALHLLFDSVPNGVLVVLRNGLTIYANPAYAKITGTDITARIGTNILELDPHCPLSQALRTGQSFKNYRFKLCDAENELVANASPFFSARGEILGAISLFQDIVEITRLQLALKEQETTIRTLKSKFTTLSSAKYNFSDIIGSSDALGQAVKIARDVARTDVTVLIRGESGVGKEMFAHSIHSNSRRNHQPFIRINCGAIPENLIESELFGYERGAFTGAAQQKIGFLELANKGTILLDEIGEMSMQVQTRFLRVLEEREFYRVGGQRPVQLDIRVLAATNRDLRKAVAEGKFREDLYYRINIFNVEIPPLRERDTDVLLLAQFFLEGAARRMEKNIHGMDEEVKSLLLSYNWPGNIRELRNVIERAVVVCSGTMLSYSDIGCLVSSDAHASRSNQLTPLSELERQSIMKGLSLYGNSMSGKQKIAKELGISPRTLYNRLKEYHLESDTNSP